MTKTKVKIFRKKVIALITAISFALQPVLVSAAVIVDQNASQNQPTVQTAANGVPIVDIAKTSNAGISHNYYQQFNVDKIGLIFNNSQGISKTQLAGYILGNPNLANGTARIILNEVTSTNPTYLKGYSEIAGNKAEIIIANPNGIYGDGFGFINANRAILTTGTPIFGGDGSLEAFRVTGGQIAIQGAGMNVDNVDQVDIISRAISVNAGIWAQNLNVIAGSNKVGYKTLHTETSDGDANIPQVAVDVGTLGGMYVKKIYLIGTENGVGVNSKGTIAAQAGDVTITSAGKVLLGGSTSATSNIQIVAKNDVVNQNMLSAQGNTNIITQGALENSGVAIAGQNAIIHAQKIKSTGTIAAGVKNDGKLGDSGDLTIEASDVASIHGQNMAAGNLEVNGSGIDLADSQTYAGGNANFTATTGEVNHSGGTLQVSGVLNAKAQGIIRNDNGTINARKVNLNGNSISNRSGTLSQFGQETTQITAANGVDNTDGKIITNGDSLTIEAGSLINSQGQIEHAGVGNLSVKTTGDVKSDNGKLITNGQLQITVQNIENTKGILSASKSMDMNMQGALQNNQGTIVSGDAIHIDAQGGINNQQGNIEANKGLTVTAQSLQNQKGRLVNLDTNDIKVNIDQDIQNQSGIIGGNGKVDITAQKASNQSGKITAQDDLTITATNGIDSNITAVDVKNDGVIASGKNLILTSAGKMVLSGSTSADGNIQVTAQGGLSNHSIIAGTGNTEIKTQGTLENSATIAAGKNATLTAQKIKSTGTIAAGVKNDGKLGDSGDLTIEASDVASIHGQNMAAGNLEVNGNGIDLAGSQTYAGGNSALTATKENIDTTSALVQVNGALNISANGELKNDKNASGTAGQIIGNKITIKANNISNREGIIQQTGKAATTLIVDGVVDNIGGVITSNGATTLTVGDLINQGGIIQASGLPNNDLSITARGVIDNSARNDQGGIITASSNAILVANSLNNSQGQVIGSQKLNILTTQGIVNFKGILAANQNVNINGSQINNRQGTIGSVQGQTDVIASAGLLDNTAGRIEAAKRNNVSAIMLNNTDGSIVGNSLSINSNTKTIDNTRGKFVADGGTAKIQSGAINNEAGLIQATRLLDIDTHGQTISNNNSGTNGGIVGQGDVKLVTGNLNNQEGYVHSGGTLTTQSATIDNTQGGVVTSIARLEIEANALNNQGGQIQSLGNIDIKLSGAINNTGSLVRSGQILSVSADTIANTGTQGDNRGMEGKSVNFIASRIDNRQGSVRADEALSLISNGSIDNTQGLMSSQQTLSLQDTDPTHKALVITNNGGTLIAGQQLNVNSAGLSGDGKVLSQGDLGIKLMQSYIHTGELHANGNVKLETVGILTNQSKLLAGGDLDIKASNIVNTTGSEISAKSNTSITATDTISNQGLIDGDETLVKAGNLTNLGMGRIYGNHLAIQSNTLNNDVENGVTPVIAARERLDIGTQSLNNREHALIFSAGDMAIGGSLDVNRRASNQAAVLNNNSSTIEALGNLKLNVRQINNTNEHFSTIVVPTTTESIVEYQGSGSPNRYKPDDPDVYIFNDESDFLHTPEGGYENWTAYRYERTTTETKVQSSDPAQIMSGGYIQINADTLTNDKSSIIAGGTLSGNIGTLKNIEGLGERTFTDTGTVTSYWRHHRHGRDNTGSSQSNYNPPIASQTISLNTTVYQQNAVPTGTGTQITSLSGSDVNQMPIGNIAANVTSNSGSGAGQAISLNSTVYQPNTAPSGNDIQVVSISDINQVPTVSGETNVTSNGQPTDTKVISSGIDQRLTGTSIASVSDNGVNSVTPITQVVNGDIVARSGDVNTKISNSSLFNVTPNSNIHYLVETDPRFSDYRNWVSSDYMLKSLSLDPSAIQKRLGDAFYEQKLIREQVVQLTGQRFLDGYASDEKQYIALMNNAVTFAKKYQLRPGVALTNEQMAQLTSDIVWLVEKDVTLPNGEVTRVLVPQLYVRGVKNGDLSGEGALIVGDNVQLQVSGDLINSGTISGNNAVTLTAENIRNIGGRVSGDNVNLKARTDLDNLGGQIKAANSLTAVAGRDINIASTTRTESNAQGNRTNIDRIASLYVTSDKGTLIANAERDINMLAAQINNSGQDGKTIFNADHNINLGTVTESQSNSIIWDSNNKRSDSMTGDVGTTIQGKGDISLKADKDLNAKAATVESEKHLEVTANGDVNITTGEASTSVDEDHKHKGKSGGLSSVTITTKDTFAETTALATTLSGDSTTVHAGQNITVKGSNIVATNDVDITAKENVTITAAEETQDEEHMKQEKKSGLLSGGGFGFTIGTERQKNTVTGQNVTQASSTVGSIQGNVTIESGKDTKIIGSEIVSEEDTKITGQNVSIEAAEETFQDKQTYEYKKSGLSVSISSPAIDTISSVANKIERAKDVKDKRVADLYEISALQDIKGLDKKIDNTVNGVVGKDKDGNVQQTRDISLNVSLGSTSYNQNSTSQGTQAKSSQIIAGKNLEITATGGEEKDKEGNVAIVGSTLNGDNVTIKANKDVTIQSAENTITNKTNSSGKTSGVGAQISTSGVGFYVEGSKSKGIENGTIVTHTQSVVTAGDTLDIQSGKDTNIIGGKVEGETVKMDVTNNLNIASEQDIDNYDEKTTSTGGKIGTGGIGSTVSANQGKTNSTYASVTEQAEIHAGKGGFDIEVGKNTDLKGAVISSDATPDKNKISTDTLTYSDIQNKADYSASSTGYSTQAGSKLPVTPNVTMPVSGDANSTTKSAISNGTIEVRSNPKQDLSQLNRDTENALNALGKIFDKETVKEQQELASLFGQEAYKAVGDLAENQLQKATTEEEKAKWKEGGEYKVLLHALVGGIMSELGGNGFTSGAVGAGVTQAVQKQLAKITDPNLRLLASYLVGTTAAKLVGGNGKVGGLTGYTGTKYNDYEHQPTTPGAIVMIDGVFYQNDEDGNPVKMDDQPPAGTVFWANDQKYYVLEEDGSNSYFYKPGTFILQDGVYWEANNSGSYDYHDSLPAGTEFWVDGDPYIVDGYGKHWPEAEYPGELKAGLIHDYKELIDQNDDLLLLMLSGRGGVGSIKMTNKQANALSSALGFEKTNYLSNGQPVYKKGKTYITPDVDGHNGGVWKAAGSVEDLGSKKTRWGTYDAELNRIGD